MSIKLFGDFVLFKMQRCLMKFENSTTCFTKTTNSHSVNLKDIYTLTKEENNEIQDELASLRGCYNLRNIIFLKAKNYSNSYRYIEVCIRYDLIYGRLWNKIDEIQCKCNLNKDTAFITMFIKTKQEGDI